MGHVDRARCPANPNTSRQGPHRGGVEERRRRRGGVDDRLRRTGLRLRVGERRLTGVRLRVLRRTGLLLSDRSLRSEAKQVRELCVLFDVLPDFVSCMHVKGVARTVTLHRQARTL